jgi:hypothetical protein
MRNDMLSLTALKYAAGDMGSVDEAAFELKLASDPEAREALSEAVRLSAAAVGQPVLPDPLFRESILERAKPSRTLIGRLFARRPYRGHPLTWTATGASLTATAAFAVWAGTPAPRTVAPMTTAMPDQVVVVTPAPATAPKPPETQLPADPMTGAGTTGERVGTTGAGPDPMRPAVTLPDPPMGEPNIGSTVFDG